jgi:hypothetical protein
MIIIVTEDVVRLSVHQPLVLVRDDSARKVLNRGKKSGDLLLLVRGKKVVICSFSSAQEVVICFFLSAKK